MKKILFAILFMMPILAFAQRYHIGDTVYSPTNEKAIVFYVFDDGNHGWAVSLKDYSVTKYWTVDLIPDFFPRISVNTNTVSAYSAYMEDIEGWKKIKDFREYLLEGWPASAIVLFPALFAADFDNGWYLPTAGQMRKLYSSGIFIENTISRLAGRWLKAKKYWTSTVADDSHPITLNGNTGKLEKTYIDQGYYLRPIRNFGYVSRIEKDKYYCRGDKVYELGYEFTAENDTLVTRTYTSYQGFDSIVGVNVHVLSPEYTLTGDMLVCMGENAEIQVTHGAGSFTYAWADQDTPNSTIGTSNSLQLDNITEANSYVVTVGQYFEEVEKYCTSRSNFDLSVIETDVAINGATIACYNTAETLSVPEGEGLQYTWFLSSDLTTPVGTGNTITTPNLTSPTAYTVSVSGGTCAGTGNITVDVAPEFSISISGDNSVCYGEGAELYATTNNSGRLAYVWVNANTNQYVGTSQSITTAPLYENTQFVINAIKTSGISPTADDISAGDIITSNNIVVKPSQWSDAERHNLDAIGVVYYKDNDTVRVVGLDEYNNIPWGTSLFTTGQYSTSYADAITKMNGKAVTDNLIAFNNTLDNQIGADYIAALKAREKGDSWYLPAEGELYNAGVNLSSINYSISLTEGTIIDGNSYYWTATEASADRAWCSVATGASSEAKQYSYKVRPVTTFVYSDLILFQNSTSCRANDTYLVSASPLNTRQHNDTIEIGQTYTYRDSTAVFDDTGDFDLQWRFHNDGDCDSVIYISVFVTPRTITVTPADNQNKTCGNLDPIFEYTLSENISNISGEISREEGETAGTYAYTTGTLDAGENYSFVIADNAPMFEILPITREINVTRCDSYAWYGNTYTQSGDYTQTVEVVDGCDSLITLHLIINHTPDTTFIDVTTCDQYSWTTMYGNTITYTESGTYIHQMYTTTGCDSIVALRITITDDIVTYNDVDACGYYEYNGNYYFDSGTFLQSSTQTQSGCDSTVYLRLNISTIPDDMQITTEPNTLCSGGYNGSIEITSPLNDAYEYSIDGVNFQSSPIFAGLMEGSYTVTLRNGACTNTSEVTVETMANRPEAVITAQSTSICEGETISLSSQGSTTGSGYTYTWTGPGSFYASSADIEIGNAVAGNSGVYTLTVRNSSSGCDKSESITITVNEATYGTDVVSACDSYTWIDGITYTESTSTATHTLTNANGCDSIVTLNLTLSQSVTSTDQATICPSELPYTYNGHALTEAGTYPISLSAANGCDSIVTFTLNVYEGYSETINVDICEYDLPYDFEGETLTESGTYTHTYQGEICDSTRTLVLNVHETPELAVVQLNHTTEVTLIVAGASTYLWETGETSQTINVPNVADTIWVIGYSEYQCYDTLYVIIDGLSTANEEISPAIEVYPVPSNGTFFVEGNNIESIEITDMTGRIIRKISVSNYSSEINLDVPSGEYLLRIKAGDKTLFRKMTIAK